MKGLCYDEMQEPDCRYCGEKILANRSHFHGRKKTFCKYTNCLHKWYELKKNVQKMNESDNPNMVRIAEMIRRDVFTNKKPAKYWTQKLNEIKSKVRQRRKRSEKQSQMASAFKLRLFWKHTTNS